MKYYYLDGIDKKGPYSLNEILSRNLSKETMIYREDRNNWAPLSDFEELNISETIDVIINKPESDTIDISFENDSNITVNDDKKIRLPSYTILIVFIVISIGISVLVTYLQQKNDYEEINTEINSLFKGKTSISDYYCSDRLEGKLYDVVFDSGDQGDPIFKSNPYVTANNITLASEPYKSPDEKDDYWYDQNLKQWELFKNLKQYYIKDKYSDGFKALNLWRSSDMFTIVTYFGGDMAYKVPEKIHKKELITAIFLHLAMIFQHIDLL